MKFSAKTDINAGLNAAFAGIADFDAYERFALRAGAELLDMEFVQFFPIGHLAPRLVGMDPIMWDPFRYKLGGRLLNGDMEEFIDRYGAEDSGQYTVTRDLATYAITREVAAGRGSPHGGAFLSFTHIAESDLRGAFGPVIDRLLANSLRVIIRRDSCTKATMRGNQTIALALALAHALAQASTQAGLLSAAARVTLRRDHHLAMQGIHFYAG